MRSRKDPGYPGGRLREWLARSLGVGKAQRLRAETQAEALATAYRQKLVAELHNPNSRARSETFAHRGHLLDLEASYVPLQVISHEEPHLHVGEVVERNDERSLFKAMLPEEALLRFRHLAVLGDPGAGKTTMLKYLALLAAQGRLENLADFPILVSLSHFAAVPQINLLDFVISEIETRYGFPGPRPELVEGPRPDGSTRSPHGLVEGPRPYLEERLEKGSVLFLLDGLGEATHHHVIGQINVLAARYPNCPMIVTATTDLRRESWKGLLAASFHTVEVLGFNRDDIQRFIVNWFGANSGAQALMDILDRNPGMWALAANPLLLSLMAFAFEQDGKLPGGRVGLYRRGAELWLKYSFTIEHQHSLLESIALHFHLRHNLAFPEDELRGVIASYLPTVLSSSKKGTMDILADPVSTVLKEISGQHGLLREQAAGWYGFPHPTWQEYFAASAISKRASNELLMLKGLHTPWWERTVLFLAGVSEDATPLLEGILAQEEDIFHSNLLLAGRCLANVWRELKVLRPREDIIEGLKQLVERGPHRLLQRRAISVLAEIRGEAVVAFFAALLRREEIDPNVRAEVATILGSLHDRSVIPDLLAFLTDEKLAPSVRRNIAGALGALGDESVIPSLLALLPDETVDPSVRGKAVEALVFLGGESVLSPLLDLLPEERIDPHVRERISGAVLRLLRRFVPRNDIPPVVSQFLSLLSDEKIHPSVRMGVAEVVGALGDKSAIPDLLALLSDEKIDPDVRGKAAEAFGVLGAESAIPPLVAILDDEKVHYNVRIVVAEILGVLGDASVASQLLTLLPDEKIDPDVRASIAGALGVLDEKSVVPQLLSLLPDERIDPAVRWRIADTLSSLGDKTIIPRLRALLPNQEIDSSVRWVVAEVMDVLAREPTEDGEWGLEALGPLDDRSKVPQLLAFLKDERLDPSMSGRIIEALGSLGNDRATVEGLAALLDREDIGSRVYEALFHVSQRAGMRVFAKKDGGYEVRPLDVVKAQRP